MTNLLRPFGRAFASALHPRMLWLMFVPFIVAALSTPVVVTHLSRC
ncbi:MAG: hypothetical protein VB142_10825 [Burkholderia sp.]